MKTGELPQEDIESPFSYFLISLIQITSSRLQLVAFELLFFFLIWLQSDKWFLDKDSSISACSVVSMATGKSMAKLESN